MIPWSSLGFCCSANGPTFRTQCSILQKTTCYRHCSHPTTFCRGFHQSGYSLAPRILCLTTLFDWHFVCCKYAVIQSQLRRCEAYLLREYDSRVPLDGHAGRSGGMQPMREGFSQLLKRTDSNEQHLKHRPQNAITYSHWNWELHPYGCLSWLISNTSFSLIVELLFRVYIQNLILGVLRHEIRLLDRLSKQLQHFVDRSSH